MSWSAKVRIIFYGAILGLLVGVFFNPIQLGAHTVLEHPLPHHYARYKDNLSLRFAMAHDVVHERFVRHGPAYYAERNRLVREQLKSVQPDSDKHFALLDDLGVGLVWLGQYPEAVDLMREKLEQQKAAGKTGKDLYSTYANLGTFLILWQLHEGLTKPDAKQRVQESIAWIKKAIEAYPDSHFGREQWQLVLEQFLLAVIDNPKLLTKYDMIGNRLDRRINPRGDRRMKDSKLWVQNVETTATRTFKVASDHLSGIDSEFQAPADVQPETRKRYRSYITEVGAEEGWFADVDSDVTKTFPFDEPTLGIIGMWTMGAGANPFFAVSLGEIMLRVGQRYLAWSAYQRAIDTAGGLWPDAAIRKKFIELCKARQRAIEAQLPPEERAQLLPRYQAELKRGQEYQQAYQEYEKQQIEAGKSIDDPAFHDAFFKEHGKIASPVGKEDKFYTVRYTEARLPVASMLLYSGVFAFVAALIVRFLVPNAVPPKDEESAEEPAASSASATEAVDPGPDPADAGSEPAENEPNSN